jgi:chemotaxis protein methyltransferase CheR
MVDLKQNEFVKLSKLIYDNFGIKLSNEKFTLVESRLTKTLIERGMESFDEFYNWVITDSSKQALSLLIDKISTNHTYFYREVEHYFHLLDNLAVFQKMCEKDPKKELRIWSAGCSYGDEPYTYAIILHDHLKKTGEKLNFKILATDINLDAVTSAKKGIYDFDRINQLPKELQKKYFTQVSEKTFQVIDEIKKYVTFRRLNFMNEIFPFKNDFHLISCRNVMIYFDEITKEKLFKKFYMHLSLEGYLYIGHSETITKQNSFFQIEQPAVFIPKKAPNE